MTPVAKKIQNNYNISWLSDCKKLAIFFVPAVAGVSGGVQSIFSFCSATRGLCGNYAAVVCTLPSYFTVARYTWFRNNENVYRLDLIMQHATNLEKIVLHIPEYAAGNFADKCSKKQRKFIQHIPKVHINIMNQNIELMPPPEKLQKLRQLTSNITQTTAHDRYASQETADHWQIPAHLLSVSIDTSLYAKRSFTEKEKLIVFSPDRPETARKFFLLFKHSLPEYKIVTVKNMTFDTYMNLISRAFAVLTFGEGFDGYFLQPAVVGTLGIAVYNDTFFPDKSWLLLDNVYESFEILYKSIVDDIKNKFWLQKVYDDTIAKLQLKCSTLYSYDKYRDNIVNFYAGKYHYLPFVPCAGNPINNHAQVNKLAS
jgi:hypothetical protein